jgi:hypothetical protein
MPTRGGVPVVKGQEEVKGIGILVPQKGFFCFMMKVHLFTSYLQSTCCLLHPGIWEWGRGWMPIPAFIKLAF